MEDNSLDNIKQDLISEILKLASDKNLDIELSEESVLQMDFYEDLQFDSIDFVNIISFIEERYSAHYEKLTYGIANYTVVSEFLDYIMLQ